MSRKHPDPRVLIAAVALQAVVGTLTVRDVARRPAQQVRGPKLLWKLWGGTNTLGALAYWVFGRKRAA